MQDITQEKFAQIAELLKTKKSLTEIIILARVTPEVVARVNRIAKIRKKSTIGNQSRRLEEFLRNRKLVEIVILRIKTGTLTLEEIARNYKLHPTWVTKINDALQLRSKQEAEQIAKKRRKTLTENQRKR